METFSWIRLFEDCRPMAKPFRMISFCSYNLSTPGNLRMLQSSADGILLTLNFAVELVYMRLYSFVTKTGDIYHASLLILLLTKRTDVLKHPIIDLLERLLRLLDGASLQCLVDDIEYGLRHNHLCDNINVLHQAPFSSNIRTLKLLDCQRICKFAVSSFHSQFQGAYAVAPICENMALLTQT